MDEISVSKFKATCLALLERVRKTGQPILITKRGEPLAQVIPPPAREPHRRIGGMKGRMTIHGDIVSPLFPDGIEPRDFPEPE